MDRQKEIETVDDNRLDTDWRENVNIDAQYTGNRQELLDGLAKFPDRWKGRLGSRDMDRHRIKLTAPDVRAISFARTALDRKNADSRSRKSTKCSA